MGEFLKDFENMPDRENVANTLYATYLKFKDMKDEETGWGMMSKQFKSKKFRDLVMKVKWDIAMDKLMDKLEKRPDAAESEGKLRPLGKFVTRVVKICKDSKDQPNYCKGSGKSKNPRIIHARAQFFNTIGKQLKQKYKKRSDKRKAVKALEGIKGLIGGKASFPYLKESC